jgi:TetR/AcrR family transcriptional repressor of nem operon
VRVTREQAAAHRGEILDVAGTLFRGRGFDGIGVADIMKGAGLKRGGFYGHFASKDAWPRGGLCPGARGREG